MQTNYFLSKSIINSSSNNPSFNSSSRSSASSYGIPPIIEKIQSQTQSQKLTRAIEDTVNEPMNNSNNSTNFPSPVVSNLRTILNSTTRQSYYSGISSQKACLSPGKSPKQEQFCLSPQKTSLSSKVSQRTISPLKKKVTQNILSSNSANKGFYQKSSYSIHQSSEYSQSQQQQSQLTQQFYSQQPREWQTFSIDNYSQFKDSKNKTNTTKESPNQLDSTGVTGGGGQDYKSPRGQQITEKLATSFSQEQQVKPQEEQVHHIPLHLSQIPINLSTISSQLYGSRSPDFTPTAAGVDKVSVSISPISSKNAFAGYKPKNFAAATAHETQQYQPNYNAPIPNLHTLNTSRKGSLNSPPNLNFPHQISFSNNSHKQLSGIQLFGSKDSFFPSFQSPAGLHGDSNEDLLKFEPQTPLMLKSTQSYQRTKRDSVGFNNNNVSNTIHHSFNKTALDGSQSPQRTTCSFLKRLDSMSPSKAHNQRTSLFQTIKSINMNGSFDGSPGINNNNNHYSSKKMLQSFGNGLNQDQLSNTSQKSCNVKTFLRFRPNNQMEIELNQQGLGQNVIRFVDNYSVGFIGDELVGSAAAGTYTVDKVYQPNDTQETLYNDIGKELIEDVFQGYNGTIFTYGVTSSGKTYTMFGDLNPLSSNEGMIPRLSRSIFEIMDRATGTSTTTTTTVSTPSEASEFILTCSMMEIYKENLFDSFATHKKNELKIKEAPNKGIYVHGLTRANISTQEELIKLMLLGYDTKRTRETRLNEYSSRSHTIFMIEVQQRLQSGDEKSGKINLIDLAGAEKVSRSGAQGESLEEAIKINLSLSCLGNNSTEKKIARKIVFINKLEFFLRLPLGKVIHSLTSGSDHIPYRDSKLTRILQESLGGNYKTSLIVTCSMHSSFMDETVSSLKFATRAKKIKNTFKMNIRQSPVNLLKEVESLKLQTESYKYMLSSVRNIFVSAKDKIQSLQNSEDPNIKDIRNKLEEFICLQDAIEDKNGILSLNPSNSMEGGHNSSLIQMIKAQEGKTGIGGGLIETLLASKRDAMIVAKDELIRQLTQTNQEQTESIQSMQQELLEMKRENLNLTAKFNEQVQEKNTLKLKLNKQLSKNDYTTFSLEILQKQVLHLVDSVCRAEKKVSTAMTEKKRAIDTKITDYLKDRLDFSEIKLAEYFKNSVNFNFETAEKGYIDVQMSLKKINLDGDEDIMGERKLNTSHTHSHANESLFEIPNNSKIQSSVVPLDSAKHSFVNANCGDLGRVFYAENNDILKKIFEMPSRLEALSSTSTESLSPEFLVVALKKQLIDAHILNTNLLRTVNALEWKQIIEYGKSKLKTDQIMLQKQHISHLEAVLDEVTEHHKQLRLKIEDLEFDAFEGNNQTQLNSNMNSISPSNFKNTNKTNNYGFNGGSNNIYQQQRQWQQQSEQQREKILIPLTPSNIRRSQILPRDGRKTPINQNMSIIQNNSGNIPSYQVPVLSYSGHSEVSISENLQSRLKQEQQNSLQGELLDLDFDVLPLTYENALEELKKRNGILKKVIEKNEQQAAALNDDSKKNSFETEEFFKNERERLNNKIVILQQELKMESVKVQSFKQSILVERKKEKDATKMNEEMEVLFRNNIKEENDSWQRAINEISEQNKYELTKRQTDYNQLKELFYNITDISLQKIEELKKKQGLTDLNELQTIISELEKAKNSIGKQYQASLKRKGSSLSNSITALAITPKVNQMNNPSAFFSHA